MNAKTVGVLGIAIAGIFLAGAVGKPTQAQQRSVTFAGWGGVTQEAERKAYFESAKTALQMTIREDSHNGYPSIKAHIQSGAVKWDVVGSSLADCDRTTKDGLAQPIDYKVVDVTSLPKEFVRPTCVGVWTFSYGIAYRSDVYKQNAPKTWADFWDVKKFPGRRSLFSNGRYLMEIALMADGVAPADVYKVLEAPGGVDRAFKKLEEIKPHISVWWGSQGQAMQLIKDKEVDMLLIANGRTAALQAEGVPVVFEYNQAVLDIEGFMVPKGAPNPKGAMELIAHSLKPEPQALFVKFIPYGPTNPKAYDVGTITSNMLASLPTAPENLKRQAVLKPEWYSTPAGEQALTRMARLMQ
jgi:putative spermidine/putrescine transport system substrate-binding protein